MDKNKETHPLIQKEFTRIRDWQTWKKLWDEARHAEQLIGLLHVAFDVEAYGEAWRERLCFLLRIADGYDTPSCDWRREVELTAETSRRHPDCRHYVVEGARPIAEKAFKALCDRYFKPRCGGHDRESVSPITGLSPEVFETLMWFFHDHDRRRYDRNLPRENDARHHAKISRDYVRELIKETWMLNHSSWDEGARVDEATEEKLLAARPKYVVLLHDLGKLHFLYERDREIDEASLEALRRLALFEDGKQKYRTTEEAVGTYAGRSLLILEATLRENERLKRIAEAERKKREAEHEIEMAQR